MLPCDAFYGTPVKFVAFVRLLLGLAYTHDYTQVIDLYWTLPFNVVWSPKYVMNYHLTIYNNLATALSRCTERTSVTKTENEVIIMQMESQVKFRNPQNNSSASRQTVFWHSPKYLK